MKIKTKSRYSHNIFIIIAMLNLLLSFQEVELRKNLTTLKRSET